MTTEQSPLEERVRRLETELVELRAEVNALRGAGPARLASHQRIAEQTLPSPVQLEKKEFTLSDWVEKIGIGLLLIGVLFLLKYSYDQGWLTELSRVVIGALIGAGLLGMGFRLRTSNRHLSAVLMGGSVAVFYGVVYASYALYDFIPFSAAFALMAGVTMGGCALAVQQRQAVLGSLAAVGGFAIPFMLSSESSEPGILAMYAALVTMGMMAIYLLRGWRSMLVTTFMGAFAVLSVAQWDLSSSSGIFERGLVLLAILLVATALICGPPLAARFQRHLFEAYEELHILLSATVAGLLLYHAADERNLLLLGLLTGLGLAIYGVSWLRFELDEIRRALRVGAYGLGAFVFAAIFDIGFYAQAMIVIGVGANLLSTKDSSLKRLVGFLAMSILGLSCLLILVDGAAEYPPYLNPDGLQLTLATLGLFIVGRSFDSESLRNLHYWFGLAAGLVVVVHQHTEIAHGAVISTLVWGVVAMSMLIYGMARGVRQVQFMGLATIVATAGKLLFFDLHDVDVIWRMGLFMLFGVALLSLSALMPRKKGAPETSGDKPKSE